VIATVDDCLAVLARGASAVDEPGLDVLSHGLQCAEILQGEFPDDVELHVAGLVHDIADAATPGDHTDHDRRGARLVRGLLGERVAHLVGGHVLAKRYLVTIEPGYRATLTARSAETLGEQGGILGATELEYLDHDADLDAMLALRRADERAKVPGADVPELASWRSALEMCAGVR
jgi:predicted HD phosphohydrolase